jgi:hypothetical protein
MTVRTRLQRRRGLALILSGAALLAGCGDPEPREMSVEEVAGQLAGMRIEPGLWELTSEVVEVSAPDLPREVRNRMVGPRSRIRHCITPEQAARPSATFLAARADGPCVYSDFTVQEGRVRGRMRCPDATAVMDGVYRPDRYEMRMEMASPVPGGATMNLEVVSRGRRIGQCEEGQTE